MIDEADHHQSPLVAAHVLSGCSSHLSMNLTARFMGVGGGFMSGPSCSWGLGRTELGDGCESAPVSSARWRLNGRSEKAINREIDGFMVFKNCNVGDIKS